MDVQRHHARTRAPASEGDIFSVEFTDQGSHPHTIHFHGVHPANIDASRGRLLPAARSHTVEAHPYGMHLYHCHATPLKTASKRASTAPGRRSAAPRARPRARHGDERLRHGRRRRDSFYTVNGLAFYYAKTQIQREARRAHGASPRGPHGGSTSSTRSTVARLLPLLPEGLDRPVRVTDTVVLCQGQRRILELEFPDAGRLMFHAHQSEFAELGWMGFFQVED